MENEKVVTISAANVKTEGASDFDLGSFPKTVTFTAGSGSDATRTITLTPADELLVEGNETLTLTPAGNTLDSQVSYTAGTVTIDDADAATVSVDAVTLAE